MTLELRPMSDEDYAAYRAHAVDAYAAQMVEHAGMDPAAAEARSVADLTELLPPDGPLPTHRLVVGYDSGERVGWLWVGPSRDGLGSWVFDVVVLEEHRGLGYGRALMVEAERLALAAGDTWLGLNVFGGNAVAIGLYASMGYGVDAQQMSKRLAAGS